MCQAYKKHIVIFEIPQGLGKGADGFRTDTAYIIKNLEDRGWSGEVIVYSDENQDAIYRYVLEQADAYIPRVNPGYLQDFSQFYKMLQKLHEQGVTGFSPPATMLAFGKKDILVHLQDLPFSVSDLHVYSTPFSFFETFPCNLEKGPRVLKRNYSSQGNGVWKIAIDDPGSAHEVSRITCIEAKNQKKSKFALDEFMETCLSYLDEPHGGLIDMPFLPRVVDGEMRVLMLGKTPVFVVHKLPARTEDAFAANLFSGAKYRYDTPDKWPNLIALLNKHLNSIQNAAQCDELPCIWSIDFLLDEQGGYILNEINATCVGFSTQADFGTHLVDYVLTTLASIQGRSQ